MPMIWMTMIPLMILAVVIATFPVLYWSVREHRELHGATDPGAAASPLVPLHPSQQPVPAECGDRAAA